MQATDSKISLLSHTLTPAPMVRCLEAKVSRHTDGSMVFFYRLAGDMVRLLIPTSQPTSRCDGLWEHTCFEAFIALPDETAYREFNFSPSGQWASYSFSSYRQPAEAPVMGHAPQISTLLTAGRLELTATIPATVLPGVAALQIGLSAVIESTDTVDGSHSYWALHHPAAHPDVHHRDSFVLDLPAP